MTDWNYMVIGGSILLLSFLLWKEYNRKNKARLVWRMTAAVFAVTSFACMALPLFYFRPVAARPNNDVILLTEGFNADSVNNITAKFNKSKVGPSHEKKPPSPHQKNLPLPDQKKLASPQKNLPSPQKKPPSPHLRRAAGGVVAFTLDARLITASQQNAKLLSSINDIDSSTIIHVFGYGLEEEQIKQLGKRPILFYPSKLPSGIASVNWNNKLESGEKLSIQGNFNNSGPGPLKMTLTAFNTTLDSIMIPGNSRQSFGLSTVPKHSGRTVYSLVILDGKDTLAEEPVPVQVSEAQPLKILLLASSPNFENKFLKNWLAEKGYQVATRTQITTNKFDAAFLNTHRFNAGRITSSLLSDFDILVTDAAELASISKYELATIQSAVSDKSMGLIVRADSIPGNFFYFNRFPIAAIIINEQEHIRFHLYDTAVALQPLKLETPFSIRSQSGTQPLATDNENRIFVSSALYGAGKIIFTTIHNTFNWALSGNQQVYENFWAEILNKAAGKQQGDEAWSISPQLPKIDKAVSVQLETNQAIVPQAVIAGTSVYLQNEAGLPFRWSGNYWPTKGGWQPAVQLDGNTFWWYAFEDNDFKTVGAFENMQATMQYALENSPEVAALSKTTQKEKAEIPKIFFFLLFLVCSGFLWLENKM